MVAYANSFKKSQASAADLPLVVLRDAGRSVTTAASNISSMSCARQFTAHTF